MERLTFDNPELAQILFGPQNLHLHLLAAASGANIFNRGSELCIDTEQENVRQALCKVFFKLYDELQDGRAIDPKSLAANYTLYLHGTSNQTDSKVQLKVIQTPNKLVHARNMGQQSYLELLKKHEIVFAVGPAGTGKTYLAVAWAVHMLTTHSVKKIILTRPAVEAGEKLGFLPGDLLEKINPYLRPLYDALYDMLPQPKVAALTELGSIEIAPLAFMRGRTLNDSYVILDEAQNTTPEQMKMFLTRMGFGSKMVITGDTTQIDLPQAANGNTITSGLIHAMNILKNIPALGFQYFTKKDVVRHNLVGEIVNAYDIAEKRTSKV
ncbi:MAG: PhoH family protein [Desulfovibrionaceae bacterium]|nr:PhoH family protein [Desulfovibrionaceae bacterium]